MAAWVSVRCPVQGCDYAAKFRIARPSAQSDDGGRADVRLTLRDEHPDHDRSADPESAVDRSDSAGELA